MSCFIISHLSYFFSLLQVLFIEVVLNSYVHTTAMLKDTDVILLVTRIERLFPLCPAWLYWLMGVCGVVCLLKSGISLLHLITASRNMAAIDVADRERERSKAQ